MQKKSSRILFTLLLASPLCASDDNTKVLEDKVTSVVLALDKAEFKPIRIGWDHDYGFEAATGMLNTFEYLRSLVSYESFQESITLPIYNSGPHSRSLLDLENRFEFGHYNPKFVSSFHSAIENVVESEAFIQLTREKVSTFGLLEKLKRLQKIYSYIDANAKEFERFCQQYEEQLNRKAWPEGGYRTHIPAALNSEDYWNWSESVYAFWIRREIDGTKEQWIEVINDIVSAYTAP